MKKLKVHSKGKLILLWAVLITITAYSWYKHQIRKIEKEIVAIPVIKTPDFSPLFELWSLQKELASVKQLDSTTAKQTLEKISEKADERIEDRIKEED